MNARLFSKYFYYGLITYISKPGVGNFFSRRARFIEKVSLQAGLKEKKSFRWPKYVCEVLLKNNRYIYQSNYVIKQT